MLIGILGCSKHGKDTIADYLCDQYGFEKITLSEPLKEVCRILFGFTNEQLYGDKKDIIDPKYEVSPRLIFQYLGTDILRRDINKIVPNLKDNIWIDIVSSKYLSKKQNNPNVKIVISDIRFENEVKRIHELNGIIIKVIRPSLKNNDEHESEKNILNIKGDYEIINDGTILDLHEKISNVFKIIYL